ncbi:putative spermidine/putrescine transport system substrate-binding protein [Mameliella alba]|uniref:ABC transporter substrate-binding protein n=2 Tax=Mameliella alba TaxID=561184 RepID=UPI0008894959|nr:extracellular solute-binding protein [Mameliella alba]OWV50470.1 ABC transporter substrate-binding protein [Mameliella alba]PTR42107.1 putative spermidine/putrescine transport system substrate-binding protein [Mameliella alba]GGF55093.1 ABC transporter substrate-binding protein [Mameliella alba]SDB98985.1 putative spermidine/putrescine transport system substrate-binding protein [Mameliella alba]
MAMNRRQFTGLMAAGLAAPASIIRPAYAQPKPGDELVVGIWGGAQEKIVKKHIEPKLVEKYGCKVSYVLGGTGERRARAYAERGRPSFDVLYLNIYESRQAVADGVTQPASPAVPNYEYLYPLARNGGYGVAFNPCTIVYDKTAASAPITSWKDMWNPEWKGRIAWPNGLGAEGISALMMTAKAWGYGIDEFDKVVEKVKELKPFAGIQGSQAQLFDMLDQNVADLSVEFASFTRMYAESRNPNCAIAEPIEGQAVTMNVACITEGTRNQKLAEEWVNLHLSPETMLAYANEIYYSPTVNNVEIPPELQGKVITAGNVDSLVDFDWDYINAHRSEWQAKYDREIAG